MNEPKIVAGQKELEALYSATRDIEMGAKPHERLRGLAESVLAILEKASQNDTAESLENGSEKDDDKK